MGTTGTAVALTLGGCRLLADALAQLVGQPELHADEGLPTLLRQLAPRLGPRQHVAHAALGQPQHLGTAQASPLGTGQAPPSARLLPALRPHVEGGEAGCPRCRAYSPLARPTPWPQPPGAGTMVGPLGIPSGLGGQSSQGSAQGTGCSWWDVPPTSGWWPLGDCLGLGQTLRTQHPPRGNPPRRGGDPGRTWQRQPVSPEL